jgi:hypothetical protein
MQILSAKYYDHSINFIENKAFYSAIQDLSQNGFSFFTSDIQGGRKICVITIKGNTQMQIRLYNKQAELAIKCQECFTNNENFKSAKYKKLLCKYIQKNLYKIYKTLNIE